MQSNSNENSSESNDDGKSLNPIALALLLESQRDALLDTWASRVLADPDLPSAAVLTHPALYDHFPEIVDRLVATLRTIAERPEDLGRLVGATEEAEAHVRGRIAAAYSVPEVLRELSQLRLAIVELCNDALPNRTSAAILHSAFDQMMVNAGNELSRVARDAQRRAEGLAQERSVLYERERDARHACEDAHRAKDQFLAIVSHELRTPLNAIAGWTELLRRDETSSEVRSRAIATIQRNAEAQARLIEDLLDFSRLRSAETGFQREEVDIAVLLRAVLESFAPAIAEKKMNLEQSFLPNAPAVVGDAQRLRQVFTNLLGNAIKFTPEAGVIRVAVEPDAMGVRIEISDSGPGIPEQFLPHAFEPFRQADSSWTRNRGGLGLGLAIAKTIVALHDGTIEARSPGEGHGATFVVTFPGARTREILPEPKRTLAQPGSSPTASGRLTGARILVVDDEDDARLLTTFVLLEEGAEIRDARSATDAFELLGNFKPDLVVSDLAMPDEDGASLLRRIRHSYGPIPAIALTAFSGANEIDAIASAGFDRHLVKPVTIRELVGSVAALLDGDGGPHAPRPVSSSSFLQSDGGPTMPDPRSVPRARGPRGNGGNGSVHS
ncbi:MAG TPA: ATP-binding protein [Polyangiaceae bacterium]|nr:ATP-binding protein [Polyangiaceae bacterium]